MRQDFPIRTPLLGVSALLAFSACGDTVNGNSTDEADSLSEVEQLAEIPGSAADTATWPGDTAPNNLNGALNGVHGAGANGGSQDVLSLGFKVGTDDMVVLSWSQGRVQNGPGTDFVVFENAFLISGGPNVFMDHVIVELSVDAEQWVTYPHDYLAEDETAYSANPEDWQGFAGVTPVLLNEDTMRVDPFDAQLAGGDHFDLDNLTGDDPLSEQIREDGFVYMRLVAAPTRVNPDTGDVFVRDAASNGADIDGVYVRYAESNDSSSSETE